MLTIENATVRLHRTLQEAEEALDQALERHAALLHSATLALGVDAKIDPVKSHATLMHMQKVIGDLTSARSNTARVHGQLLKFGQELAGFAEDECPDLNTAVLIEDQAA